MARCPKCKAVYGAGVQRCPVDGQPLAVSGETPTGVFQTGETLLAQRGSRASASPAATPHTPVVDLSAPLDAAPALTELAAGSKVGEYEVKAQIGEGGMGTVYAGVHPVIGKRVAIKVLNPGLSHDAGVVQRFVQEARAVNQIGHRNIVDIFAFGRLPDGRHYFVMEFLPGKSLFVRLGQEPPLSYDEAFQLLLEVCDALIAAHAEGIVHRDLKPDNIFLAESKSGQRVVKLLDFGIAKLLRRDEGVQQTRTGMAMGTPLYMAPEQCLGRAVDARTDIYALGVIMFELFTGQLPFPGPSYIETVNGHLKEPPPDPRSYVEIPDGLSGLILRCMAKGSAERPQSISEVRQDLIAIGRGLGADLGRRTGTHPTMPPALTPRRRTPAQSGLEAAPLGGTASAPRSLEPAPVRKRRTGLWLAGLVALLVAGGIGAAVVVRPGPAAAPSETPEAPSLALQVVSDPPGAVVTIDGKRQSLRTPTIFKLPRQGKLAVRVEKDGFKPYEETVTLGEGENEKAVVATLAPTKVAGAQLRVRTNAKQASWKLDGRPVGDGTGTLALKDLPPGEHRVAIEAKGFDGKEETVELLPNGLASLDWNLTSAAPSHKPGSGRSTASGKKPARSAADEDVNSTSGWPPK